MRHVVKYLLALAVLMSGFYMARMFRVPQSADGNAEAVIDEEAERPSAVGGDTDAPRVSDQLPVAALVDVDKAPTAAVEDLARFGADVSEDEIISDNGRRPLSAQPTVRRRRDESSENAQRRPSYEDAVPDFAAEYQPWLDPLEQSEPADPDQDQVSGRMDASDDEPTGDQQAEREPGSADDTQRHRIVEGDTLRGLAAQYLGDRDRYLDLYEANKDVLFHPRLLPIGIEIAIPVQPDRFAADEIDDSEDLTAQRDTWEDGDQTDPVADSAYSPWDEY